MVIVITERAHKTVTSGVDIVDVLTSNIWTWKCKTVAVTNDNSMKGQDKAQRMIITLHKYPKTK